MFEILSRFAFNSDLVAVFISSLVVNAFIFLFKLDSLINFFCVIFASSVLLVNLL